MTEDEMLLTVSEIKAEVERRGYTCAELEDFTAVQAETIRRLLTGKTKQSRRETMLALSAVLRPFLYDQFSDGHQKGQAEYTIEDYLALPADRHVELIDGVFYDIAEPNERHQYLSMKISMALLEQISNAGEECMVYTAPLDVYLDSDEWTVVQPDIFIACDSSRFRDGMYCGAPDFVIEIISPSTRIKDFLIKGKKYRYAGVREYWIVDLLQERVIVYVFEGDENLIYGMNEAVPVYITGGRIEVDFNSIRTQGDGPFVFAG